MARARGHPGALLEEGVAEDGPDADVPAGVEVLWGGGAASLESVAPSDAPQMAQGRSTGSGLKKKEIRARKIKNLVWAQVYEYMMFFSLHLSIEDNLIMCKVQKIVLMQFKTRNRKIRCGDS